MSRRRAPHRPRASTGAITGAITGAVLVALVLAAVVGVRATGVVGRRGAGDPLAEGRPGTALAALGGLAVKGRAPKTGYARTQFGQAWTDVDRNGCDTRDDVLARDLRRVTHRPGHPCEVASGVLADPYRPHRIDFRRGPDSTAVQIDHVVALSDAWQTGAQRWSPTVRTAFANDPLNLLAVDGPLNEAKGDADAATWLPPNKGFRCAYVARQVAVKADYGAWVTRAERDAMARVLSGCREEPLPARTSPAVTGPAMGRFPLLPPAGAAAPRVAPQPAAPVPPRAGTASPAPAPPPAPADPTPAPPAAPAPPVAPAPAAPPAGGYTSCAAARAAGAAPLHAGDPGYSRVLDRDGDGSACE